MKTKSLFFAALMCMMMCSLVSFADDERVVPPDQLPKAAKTFLGEYFSVPVSYVKKDVSMFDTEYEVRLTNGIEIEFNRKGDWKKVDCKFQAVPSELIPDVIAQHIESAHPGEMIVKIDRKNYGYEIELSTDLEIMFDEAGQFLGYDY